MKKYLTERMAIFSTASRLLQEKSFDSLTVAEICKEANLSKTTFYRLFSCKYSIAQWLIGVYAADGLDEIGRSLNWHEGLYRTACGLARHKKFLKAANQTQFMMESPQVFTQAKRKEVLFETLMDWKRVEVSERLRFQVDVYALSSSQIAAMWHSGSLVYSLEEYVELLESIVPHDLHETLDRPVAAKRNSDGASDRSANYLTRKMLDALGD